MRIGVDQLETVVMDALQSRGVPLNVGTAVKRALIEASLLGIDSHGVRLLGHYLKSIDEKQINPLAPIDFVDSPGRVVCNANSNFAHFAASELLPRLGREARQCGIAIGGILGSGHIGALGIHAVNAGLSDLVVLGFTNSNPLSVTPDGDKVLFGTNPISLVTGSDTTFIYLDVATTGLTINRARMLAARGEELEPGLARDEDFLPTTVAQRVRYLEPLAGHKGFVLAYLVETLTSGLLGTPHSQRIPEMYSSESPREIGHTFIAVDREVFGFLGKPANINGTIGQLTNPSWLPGQRELAIKTERLGSGIPVDQDTLDELHEAGVRLD